MAKKSNKKNGFTLANAKPPVQPALTLAELETQILAALAVIKEAGANGLRHAMETGQLLNRAKVACEAEHRKWGLWVLNKFGVKERTANNYCRIAENWPKIESYINARVKDSLYNGEDEFTVRAALALIKGRGKASRGRPIPPTKPIPNDRQKKAMAEFLKGHGVKCEPMAFIAALWDMGLRDFTPILKGLDKISSALDRKEWGDWLAKFKDATDAWSDACEPFDTEPEGENGTKPDVLAWAAVESGQEVFGFTEEAFLSGSRPAKQFDTLIDHASDYFFVDSRKWRPEEMARKTVEWIVSEAGYELAEEQIGDENIRKLEKILAAMSATETERKPSRRASA